MNRTVFNFRRTALLAGLASLSLGMFTQTAAAQDAAASFPNKTITIVVPYAPGGSSDTRARQLGQRLSSYWGQSVVVENKSGGNGNIGTNAIAKAAPDGYTIGIGNFAPLVVNKTLMPSMTFDPSDLAPIALMEKGPVLLLVNAEKSPHKDLKSFVTALKDSKGKMSFASAGAGGIYHLSAELLKSTTNAFAVHIPYRSGGQALNDLVAGQVDFMFDMAPASMPFVKGSAPKMRALAVGSDKRLASLPDVPTFAEQGYKNMEISNWLGIVGPKGIPPAIINKINQGINRALQEPDFARNITGPGNIIVGGSPQAFSDFLVGENKRWNTLIKERGIKGE